MIRIVREPATSFDEYARVSIAFPVRAVLDVRRTGAHEKGRFILAERPVPVPWVKDYDRSPGEAPTSWPDRFDTSSWAVFAAYSGDTRVGGAVGIVGSSEIEMLEGDPDLAVLWDIRVAPHARRRGVGPALLAAVEQWARDEGARRLGVETQDTNLPACRFYARRGFRLEHVNRHVYPEWPDEAQLLWYKDLANDTR